MDVKYFFLEVMNKHFNTQPYLLKPTMNWFQSNLNPIEPQGFKNPPPNRSHRMGSFADYPDNPCYRSPLPIGDPDWSTT